VIELRMHGVNKGLVVAPILARNPHAFMVALGDDTTDDDLFAALPADAICIHVGTGESRSALRVRSPREVRTLLRLVADAPVKTSVAAAVG
jgi:trehalose 6-phosphate synthase/phosphatase